MLETKFLGQYFEYVQLAENGRIGRTLRFFTKCRGSFREILIYEKKKNGVAEHPCRTGRGSVGWYSISRSRIESAWLVHSCNQT